jgi:hypothetical protein
MVSEIAPTQLSNPQTSYPTATMSQNTQNIETPEAIPQKTGQQTASDNTGTSSLLGGVTTGAVVGGGQTQSSDTAPTTEQLPTPNGLSNIPNGNFQTTSDAVTQEINRLKIEIAINNQITEITNDMNQHFSERPRMSMLTKNATPTDTTETLSPEEIQKLKSLSNNTSSGW